MSTSASRSLLLEIACDFLIPGDREPLAFAPEGPRAIAFGAELSAQQGELERGLGELLDLTHHLEGRGDSPGAAASIRRAIAAIPGAAERVGATGVCDLRALAEKARQRARARAAAPLTPASSSGRGEVKLGTELLARRNAAALEARPRGAPRRATR